MSQDIQEILSFELTAEEQAKAVSIATESFHHDRKLELFRKLNLEGVGQKEADRRVLLLPILSPPQSVIDDAVYQIKERKFNNQIAINWLKSIREKREVIQISKTDLRTMALKKLMESARLQIIAENIPHVYHGQSKEAFDFLLAHFMDESEESHKGTFLIGGVGVGKTALHKAFKLNPKGSYNVVSCQQVTNEYKENGIAAIRKYSTLQTPAIPQLYLNQEKTGWAFDDLGAEGIVKNYGDGKDVFVELIAAIYDQPKLWSYFHFNSNLKPDEIEERYKALDLKAGERTRSRLRAICSMKVFDNNSKDLRK